MRSKMDTTYILTELVNQFIVRPGQNCQVDEKPNQFKAMAFNLTLEAFHQAGDCEAEERQNVFFLFHNQGGRRIRVWFAAPAGVQDIMDVPYNAWQETSFHDSCWLLDGFNPFNRLCREMVQKVRNRGQEKALRVTEINLDTRFGHVSCLYQDVVITIEGEANGLFSNPKYDSITELTKFDPVKHKIAA